MLPKHMARTLLLGWDLCKGNCAERSSSAVALRQSRAKGLGKQVLPSLCKNGGPKELGWCFSLTLWA